MKIINLYRKIYQPHQLSNKYKKVDDYLLRGPHPGISDLIELKNAGVTQIYDFRHKSVRGFKFIEKFACKELGINYIRYPFSYLNGEYPTVSEFERIAQDVKLTGQNGGKTLFHCNSGSHRTAHMAAYYDLTKGENIDVVFNKLGVIKYSEKIEEVVDNHFYRQNFFNRKATNEKTLNPLKYLRNRFNNRVKQATENAHASFIAIVTRYKNW